jgi:hypothetical protein
LNAQSSENLSAKHHVDYRNAMAYIYLLPYMWLFLLPVLMCQFLSPFLSPLMCQFLSPFLSQLLLLFLSPFLNVSVHPEDSYSENIPLYALENRLWIGDIPDELPILNLPACLLHGCMLLHCSIYHQTLSMVLHGKQICII